MISTVLIAAAHPRPNIAKPACELKATPPTDFSSSDVILDDGAINRKPTDAPQRTLSAPVRPDSPPASHLSPTGEHSLLHRQVSLPNAPCSGASHGELKSILKRCQSAISDSCTGDSPDSDYASASPSPSLDFWYDFRSADDVFLDESDEAGGLRRRRVSFSEKIQRSTYRVGTCILQQKQKAQKRKDKRQARDSRRTASESDASDFTAVTDGLGNLSVRPRELDFAQTVDILEEVVEVDEEQTREQAAASASKKRKNWRKRKTRAHSESS